MNRMVAQILLGLTIFSASIAGAQSKERVRCSVQLYFQNDDFGPAAEYHLIAQITNRTGRPVSGAAVLYFNDKSDFLGNVELNCADGRPPLYSGSTGQCSSKLQKIDGKMMEKFGTDIWTNMVNFQLSKLESIHYCDITGYRYSLKSN